MLGINHTANNGISIQEMSFSSILSYLVYQAGLQPLLITETKQKAKLLQVDSGGCVSTEAFPRIPGLYPVFDATVGSGTGPYVINRLPSLVEKVLAD